MKGIFINCGNGECKKMLLKNAYMRPGSFLTVKCFHCGTPNEVTSEAGKINVKAFIKVVEKQDLTEDEESDIVVVNL